MGLCDDMKVVEPIPGGGWYTRLLAPVLAFRNDLNFDVTGNTDRFTLKFVKQ